MANEFPKQIDLSEYDAMVVLAVAVESFNALQQDGIEMSSELLRGAILLLDATVQRCRRKLPAGVLDHLPEITSILATAKLIREKYGLTILS